jgi:hypothetical protein
VLGSTVAELRAACPDTSEVRCLRPAGDRR